MFLRDQAASLSNRVDSFKSLRVVLPNTDDPVKPFSTELYLIATSLSSHRDTSLTAHYSYFLSQLLPHSHARSSSSRLITLTPFEKNPES